MNRVKFIAILVTVLSATLVACTSNEASKKGKGIVEENLIAVSLAPVERVRLARPVKSSGLVNARDESRLSFKVGGIIKQVYVEEGQAVQAGQLLATLDLTEIDAQVNQASAQVEKWKRDVARTARLYKDSAATLEQLQNVQTALDLAVESLRTAEFNRQFASIKAPNAGKILRKLMNAGELTGPGTPVFFMNSAGRQGWEVKLALTDVDWVRVQPGDVVQLTTDAYPSEVFEGKIASMGEGADPFTGLYQAEVTLAPSKQLSTGFFMTAEIKPTQKMELTKIPVESLVEGSGLNASVYVLAENKKNVKRLPVKIAFVRRAMPLWCVAWKG